MRVRRHFDCSWLYLFSGLLLTIAAIVLPAHQDLAELEVKREAIAFDLAHLEHQIGIHEDFLEKLEQQDPTLRQRIQEMQFNVSPDGIPIVTDRSAANTPLAWIDQRARQEFAIDIESQQASILSELALGNGRLWLAGIGVFAMFVGLRPKPIHHIS